MPGTVLQALVHLIFIEESIYMGLWVKFLQARLQQYVNREVPDVQAGFRKGSDFT